MERFVKVFSIIIFIAVFVFGQTQALRVTAAELPDSPEAPVTTEDSSGSTETPDSTETPSTAEIPDTESATEEPDEPPPVATSETLSVVGDTDITTGDISSSGIITNDANVNVYGNDENTGGLAIINEDNGAGSDNSGGVVLDQTEETAQTNAADLDNSLSTEANTGDNSASGNVGSSSIETGDANVSGTILNMVNTNLAGVAVSEFNIEGDYLGDYTLDFSEEIIISNLTNGAGSTSSGEIKTTSDDISFQSNTADVENELVLSANSGGNTTDNNTGGDNTISTGDANVSGSVINFINNNILGNVIYGVVNIFGNLIGDIILTDTGNGTGSTNTGNVSLENLDNTTQFNSAEIQNNIALEVETGGNTTSNNTGGDNEITTGDALIDAQVVNIANTNVSGGTWWIVLVNEDGSNIALSQGSQSTTPDGTINITNEGNGADSINTGEVDATTNSSVTQTNDLTLTNNVSLSANTGGNSASRNTGGNNQITTGDATVMLNIINFVNNNYSGNIIFTVVNVFGSWVGDFVTPGNEKEVAVNTENTPDDQTGQQINPNPDSNNSSSGGESSENTESTVVPSESNKGSQLLVAGVKIVEESQIELPLGQFIDDKQQTKERMQINLAWLLLILPALGLIALAGRKISQRL